MWKNITSYSKSDDRTKIRTTKLAVDGLSVVVTKHIHYGDELVMRCPDVNIDLKALGVTDMLEGQRKALDIIETKLKKMVYAIEQIKG